MEFAVVSALIILASLCFVAAIVMADIWFSHRQWVAIWRGHRIRVRTHRAKIFVELDDKEIFVQKNGLIKTKYEQEWEHPALGSTNILVEKITKGSDGIDLNM